MNFNNQEFIIHDRRNFFNKFTNKQIKKKYVMIMIIVKHLHMRMVLNSHKQELVVIVGQKIELDIRPQPTRYCPIKQINDISCCCVDTKYPTMNPGKGTFCEFSKNVDIDSDLRNLQGYLTKCDVYRTQLGCSENVYKDQDYEPEFDNDLPIVNHKSPFINMSHIISNKNKDIELCEKYIKVNPVYENCVNGKNVRYYRDKPFDCNQITNRRKEPLVIGPKRVDHKCERIWNNITKRITTCNKK